MPHAPKIKIKTPKPNAQQVTMVPNVPLVTAEVNAVTSITIHGLTG